VDDNNVTTTQTTYIYNDIKARGSLDPEVPPTRPRGTGRGGRHRRASRRDPSGLESGPRTAAPWRMAASRHAARRTRVAHASASLCALRQHFAQLGSP